MTKLKKLVFFVILAGLVFSCEQPFKAGLGPKTDITAPVLGNISPSSGAFLSGPDKVKIEGNATDDIGVDRVEVRIAGSSKDTGFVTTAWEGVTTFDKSTGKWTYELDTSLWEDGELSLEYRVFDTSGKVVSTPKLSYTVKNTPPQIEMTIPGIKGIEFDREDLDDWLDEDPVYMGNDLRGVASDIMGIWWDKDNSNEQYPQIQFWSAYSYVAGYIPTETEIPWMPLTIPNARDGMKATQFSWSMSGRQEGYYRFRLRIKDLNGVVNTYPNRSDNKYGYDPEKIDENQYLNQYIQIHYIASESPIISLRTIPTYYNGVGDFKVTMTIDGPSELKNTVEGIDDETFEQIKITCGYITNYAYEADIANPLNRFTSELYPLEFDTSSDRANTYILTIPAEKAADWIAPPDGTLYVQLVATDVNNKKSPPTFRNFIYDIDPPEVVFDRPVIGRPITGGSGILSNNVNGIYSMFDSNRWVTGTINVGGISKDQFGVKKVYYHIGKLGDDDVTNDSDREAKYSNELLWTDTLLDTQLPDTDWSGSVYAWTFSRDFNYFRDEDPTKSRLQEGEDIGYPSTIGTSRFYLPFYVKIIDNAGNQHVVHYKLYIDPDMDIPQASFTNPDPNKTDNTVGGIVRVSGTASDNNWVHSVEIKVKAANIANPGATWYENPAQYFYYKNNEDDWAYPLEQSDPDKVGWIKAKIVGNTDLVVAWFYNINNNGELNPEDPETYPLWLNNNRNVRIEVRAIDTKDTYHEIPGLIGIAEILNIEFSDKVPTISTPTIIKTSASIPVSSVPNRSYYEGIRVSGEFTFEAIVSAVDQMTSLKSRLPIAGEISFRELIKEDVIQSIPPGYSLVRLPNNGNRHEYRLSINLNTTEYSSLTYGRTGELKLELQLSDPVPYNANGTYTLSVDNYYPTADIETKRNASTSNFYLMGTARDYGTTSGSIQGLEKMLVYFQRGSTYFNAAAANITSSMITWPNVKDMSLYPAGTNPDDFPVPNVPSFSNFPNVTYNESTEQWVSTQAIVLGNNELRLDVLGENIEEQWQGRLVKEWMARLDLGNRTAYPFADGPLTVHYILMDLAGNATHYTQEIYVENNKPLITFINLGTDLNSDGNVNPWLSISNYGEHLKDEISIGEEETGEITTNFRVRNSRFNIRINTLYGNNGKHYVVNNVERDQEVTALDAGKVYTIETPGKIDWKRYGAPAVTKGTTFVASSDFIPTANDLLTENKGTAWSYNYIAGTEKRGNFPGSTPGDTANLVQSILFEDAEFANMPDTSSKTYTDGNMNLLNDKRFIIKVYDTTVSAGLESEQLAHVALINVDFDNDDAQVPLISIDPFYWNSATDNSLYGKNKANGHIELESDLTFSGSTFSSSGTGVLDLDPKVSGQVSFRGTAFDNITIGNIYFRITNHTNLQTTVTSIEGVNYYLAASYSGGTWIKQDRFDDNGWKFEIENETLDQDGHSIDWRLDFDSSKIANVASANNVLTIVARDTSKLVTSGNPSTTRTWATTLQTNLTTKTEHYRFDVVPYISELVTGLTKAYNSNPSAFNRSANGWYPVRQSDVITIRGFNLRADSNPTVNINDVNTNITFETANSNDPTNIASLSNSNTLVRIGVGPTVNSGELVVTVNSIDSLNNLNKLDAPYNQEPNNLNNNTLNDNRNLYLWQIGYLINDSLIEYPVMRIANDGRRRIAYTRYSGGGQINLKYNSTGTGAETTTTVESATNRYLNTALAVDTAGDWYIGIGNMTATYANNYNIHARANSGNASHEDGANKRHLLSLRYNPGSGNVDDANRVKNARISVRNTNGTSQATTTNRAQVVISYLDSALSPNNLILHYGSVYGTTAPSWGGDLGGGNSSFATQQVVASNTTTHQGSIYSAVGILSNGRPVIAWYDNYNQDLVFSYGDTAANNATSTSTAWQSRAVIIQKAAGTHVDLAVDGSNNIHLAYYDVFNGGLWYAYIPNGTGANAGTPDVASRQTIRVDTYLSSGTKIMLNVREEGTGNYVPYITYLNASFAETRNAVRVAWRKDFTVNPNAAGDLDPESNAQRTIRHGTNEDDSFTGAWEVMTVPSQNIPLSEYLICNGVPTSTTWNYTSTGLTYNTNILNTIILGYMTGSNYEGAILKGNVRSMTIR